MQINAPWWVCILLAVFGGAVLGAAAGALKAYLNVNEVIACIMLNWVSLYAVNTVLTAVKESGTTYTLPLRTNNPSAIQYIDQKKAFSIVKIAGFEVNWFMIITIVLLIAANIVLYHTKLGLRLMACGEHPQAADSVGINVYKMHYIGVLIFGQWKPNLIALTAVIFGLFRALSNVYSGFDFLVALNIPGTFYKMLPYIISLLVLAVSSKKSRAPKAEGIPYDKGQR